MNPLLDDVAPVRLLREGLIDEIGPTVVDATQAFAAGP
jgi:hypothetical protein